MQFTYLKPQHEEHRRNSSDSQRHEVREMSAQDARQGSHFGMDPLLAAASTDIVHGGTETPGANCQSCHVGKESKPESQESRDIFCHIPASMLLHKHRMPC
jgi:uncharacterized membrane protein